MSKDTLRKIWNFGVFLFLILWAIDWMAMELGWTAEGFTPISDTTMAVVVGAWILGWDWRQMKRRQRKGEQFWLFQALLVLILIALAATVLFIFVPSLAPWA